MKVSEAIARTLVREGVEVVFSLLGDTNMDVVAKLAELGVPVHESRHEATAFAMADGYSRASGKLVVCSVTAGPGFAHTFVPMMSAAEREPSRVILLTGPHSRDDLHHRQHLDHEGLARLARTEYQPLASPGAAVDRTQAVVDRVRSNGRPVVFDVPFDVQSQEFPWDVPDESRPTPGWELPQRMHPDPEAVTRAAELIKQAERPVVLAGGGAKHALEPMVALARATGALLATSINARGLFHGDDFNAGNAGLFAWKSSAELFAEADLVVAFGASLNGHTTEGGYIFPMADVIQVDTKEPGPMQSDENARCYVRGDAEVVAAQLVEATSGDPVNEGFRTTKTLERLRSPVDETDFPIAEGEIDPRALCERLDELLPEDCGFVSGAAHYWSFPQLHMPRYRDPLVYSNYFGSIGYSVSVGLGVALGANKPVVVFEGDGGFLLNPHAIETAARTGARVLVMVMNDQALGAEYHKLAAKGLDASLAAHPLVDIANIASEFGCSSHRLTDLDQLPAMVGEFAAGEGPMLIDVRISRSVVSQPYRRLHFGQE